MAASTETAAQARTPAQGLPDFFIVGHAKCGTTALYEMLRRHPRIFMPDHKEPWFFARDNPRPEVAGRSSAATFDQTGVRSETLDDYLSLFAAAKPDQLLGEASSSYLWSRTAARKIAAVRPDARIVAIMREPASFLRSLHLQLLQNRHESVRDFRKALSLDEERRQGRSIPSYSTWPQALIYSDRVRYVEQLRRYYEAFPSEQVLVLIYDDFRADNEGTVRRVLRFLGLDDTVRVDVMHVNPTIRLRSDRIRTLVGGMYRSQSPAARGVKATVNAFVPKELRREALRRLVWGKPQPPDEALMSELRQRYKPEVVALSEFLGRDLVSLWGYDSIA